MNRPTLITLITTFFFFLCVCAYKVSKGSGQKKITKTPQKHTQNTLKNAEKPHPSLSNSLNPRRFYGALHSSLLIPSWFDRMTIRIPSTSCHFLIAGSTFLCKNCQSWRFFGCLCLPLTVIIVPSRSIAAILDRASLAPAVIAMTLPRTTPLPLPLPVPEPLPLPLPEPLPLPLPEPLPLPLPLPVPLPVPLPPSSK
jgi:hypothetical protein